MYFFKIQGLSQRAKNCPTIYEEASHIYSFWTQKQPNIGFLTIKFRIMVLQHFSCLTVNFFRFRNSVCFCWNYANHINPTGRTLSKASQAVGGVAFCARPFLIFLIRKVQYHLILGSKLLFSLHMANRVKGTKQSFSNDWQG